MAALVLADHAPQALVRQFVQDNQVHVQVLDSAQAPCQAVDHFLRAMLALGALVQVVVLAQVADIPARELPREVEAAVLVQVVRVVPVVVGLAKHVAHLVVAALKVERVIVNRNLERLVAKR
jgi:hypothetical protein